MIETFKLIAGILILLGAFLFLASTLGVIRLPDVYTRNHAASKSTTLGVISILIGTCIYFYAQHGHFNSRLILAIFFILLTAPVAGHLISRAAYNTNVKLWKNSSEDDLEKARMAKRKE
ncbi:monovalent cation/H(+) antiporter subunit G [Peribacillus psychrosaccharolyticus]|uniref:monovalent cation/H(+) antiporter subunit G n=1 Tax=Peribacillus psychrosaccharolyticus TaxID=1407 RepID=UPI003D26D039